MTSKLKMVLKGASNINAFKNLVYVVGKMKDLNRMYSEYPRSPEQFDGWKARVEKEIHEAKERFKPNPI